MTNNCWKPKHCSQCIPGFVVKNMQDSIDFYTKAFGFKIMDDATAKDEEGNIMHAMMQYDECTIMFYPEGAFDQIHKTPNTLDVVPSMQLYYYVKNVDETYATAVANGAKSDQEPMDSNWGDRFCKIIDINGYAWLFATVMCNHQH